MDVVLVFHKILAIMTIRRKLSFIVAEYGVWSVFVSIIIPVDYTITTDWISELEVVIYRLYATRIVREAKWLHDLETEDDDSVLHLTDLKKAILYGLLD